MNPERKPLALEASLKFSCDPLAEDFAVGSHCQPRSRSFDYMGDVSVHTESILENRHQLLGLGFFVQTEGETHGAKFGIDLAFGQVHP